jgi:hypothetical protein
MSQKMETNPLRRPENKIKPYAKDLISLLLILYISPLPFFPVSACPCFYSFLYTLYSETLDFPPPNMISLPPFSYLLYSYFINWISDLHLQGTLSEFTPEEIYSFSNILFTLLYITPPMLSLHPLLWVILVLVPTFLSVDLWATSPPEWRWPHRTALCLRYR